jgi:hypothetical protein
LFADPNMTFGGATFGVIGSWSGERMVQLALKLTF